MGLQYYFSEPALRKELTTYCAFEIVPPANGGVLITRVELFLCAEQNPSASEMFLGFSATPGVNPRTVQPSAAGDPNNPAIDLDIKVAIDWDTEPAQPSKWIRRANWQGVGTLSTIYSMPWIFPRGLKLVAPSTLIGVFGLSAGRPVYPMYSLDVDC